jgi:hypothetical protein
MGPVMVAVVDPGTEFESGLFDGLEAVAPTELFFEVFDETLAQAVLLRCFGVAFSTNESVPLFWACALLIRFAIFAHVRSRASP